MSSPSWATQVSKDDDDDDVSYVAAAEPANRPEAGEAGFFESMFGCCSANNAKHGEPAMVRGPIPGKSNEYSLLPPQVNMLKGRKTLLLDLDETLVHSTFQKKHRTTCDMMVKVDIEDVIHEVYVYLRPGLQQFLKYAAEKFEVVIWTASQSRYADPVLDEIDPDGCCFWRLFRDSCVKNKDRYVKDMSILGRPAESALLLDNSPLCYMFQPEQGLAIESWFDERDDTALYDILPILDELAACDDVQQVIKKHELVLVKSGKHIAKHNAVVGRTFETGSPTSKVENNAGNLTNVDLNPNAVQGPND